MKHVMLIAFLILVIVSASFVQAEQYKGDGAWAVSEYGKNIVLVFALNIFRENPDKGAIPCFMVNYGYKDGCFVSFGLTMFVKDIPKQLNKKVMLDGLRSILEHSDFLADDKVLSRQDIRVQALDMGTFIYARTLIDANALAAFMLAKKGAIKIRNKDAVIVFDMYGFKKTINRIMDIHCK